MAGQLLYYSICLFALICGTRSDYSETVENSERKTNVKVNIPNIFNLMPNLGKLMEDFEKDVQRSDPNSQETASKEHVPEHIHQVKDNYKTLREFVQSALNLGRRGLNTDGLFSLDLRNNGPNTKLDLRSIFGRMSMATKSQKVNGMEPIEEPIDAEEPTTEVPLNEYLHDLIEEQAKGMNDFALSVFGPRDERIAAVKSAGQKTTVDVSAPVQVSVDARARNVERYGDMLDTEPTEPRVVDEAIVELDPETEYLQHVEQLHRNQLLMRGYETDYENSDEVLQDRPSSSPLLDMLRPNFRPRDSNVRAKVRDPVKKMTEYYYNLSTGKSKDSEDHDSFEDYIEDIEKATGALNENSKEQLQSAFEKFKASIENIDFGERIDVSQFIDEPEDNVWLPGRIIDQRDLEIAFLNINKNDKPKPGDRMVLAFTLAGVPLKIFMDSEIENPVPYLHKRLTEAGVTLNIPVSSFQDMEPSGSEVLYVGAGNNGKSPTRAMSIIIPKAENIRSYVKRYSKASNLPLDVEKESMKEIREALEKAITSDEDQSFLDALSESVRGIPNDKVLREIIHYIRRSSVKTSNPTLEDAFEKLN